MKRNNGFTLVELMMVIVLIGVIIGLASIPISKLIKDSKEKLNNDQKQQIVLATENWVVDNPYEVVPYIDGDYTNVTLEFLLDEGYLEDTVINLNNNEEIVTCSYVQITLNSDSVGSNKNTYKYEFFELESC